MVVVVGTKNRERLKTKRGAVGDGRQVRRC